MIISHVRLKNWRNFRSVDVSLANRVFLVGPNASGKSNLLDAVRFLSDIAKPGGGLQKATENRGGLSKIRCLAARQYPDVELDVELGEASGSGPTWRYAIGIKQETRGNRRPYLAFERVWRGGKQILERPDEHDRRDRERLIQTHLEQINANVEFREIARFLDSVLYLHLVPQLIRYPKAFTGPGVPGDPFGKSFLERIGKSPEKTRRARLRRIENALRYAVPQLKELAYTTADVASGGAPHLEAVYERWRPHGARQQEVDFSDGTLRLVGLLWALMEGELPLLLEEPELSLNVAIVKRLPSLIHRATCKTRRQVIISTHSFELLSDKGIGGEEVLLLEPSKEGTMVRLTSEMDDARAILEAGMSVGEAVLPRTEPKASRQLLLFEL